MIDPFQEYVLRHIQRIMMPAQQAIGPAIDLVAIGFEGCVTLGCLHHRHCKTIHSLDKTGRDHQLNVTISNLRPVELPGRLPRTDGISIAGHDLARHLNRDLKRVITQVLADLMIALVPFIALQERLEPLPAVAAVGADRLL